MSEFKQAIETGKTPWPVWWSLIAGFVAWAGDLGFSYMLEQHSCSTGHHYVLHAISVACMAVALSGFLAGVSEFRKFPNEANEHGGSRYDRAHFQALMGMMYSLSFAFVVLAGAVPRWILSPCD